MGTRANLVIHAHDQEAAEEAAEAVFERVAAIEDVLSDWQLDSEVVRLRGMPAGFSIVISHDLDKALASSFEISLASGGAFDVTCGRLTHLWRGAKQAGRLPSSDSIEEARAGGGWQQLERIAGQDGPMLRSRSGSPWLDFGGIGKGMAADEALDILQNRGLDRSLVDLGGDMAIGSPPPGKSGWRIEALNQERTLVVSQCGVATSGSTEQFMLVDGHRLSHLLHPKTGQAVPDRGSFTVMAPTATQADAWASVAAVVGVEAARGMVDPAQEILFIEEREDSTANP